MTEMLLSLGRYWLAIAAGIGIGMVLMALLAANDRDGYDGDGQG